VGLPTIQVLLETGCHCLALKQWTAPKYGAASADTVMTSPQLMLSRLQIFREEIACSRIKFTTHSDKSRRQIAGDQS